MDEKEDYEIQQEIFDLKEQLMAKRRVDALISTDDNNLAFDEIDVTAWFEEEANEEDLLDLIQDDFAPGYLTDQIAEYAREIDGRIHDLFRYLTIVNRYRTEGSDSIGFSCAISADDAMRWIAEHYPVLFREHHYHTDEEDKDEDEGEDA